ncbi:MAG: thrombospondin type 3 repeat-containing protein [Pseudomonadales bacterium]|nr:thrombospondin type 3 repeat-containing protein [Pseudomonadales bacterium]
MLSTLLKRILLLISASLLMACLGLRSIVIEFPSNGASYIGDDTLQDFSIDYGNALPTGNIFLNGASIGNLFTFNGDIATADIDDIKPFLKQGTNLLTVEPLTLGPTVGFNVDTDGPDVVVKSALRRNDAGIIYRDISGYMDDPSNLISLQITSSDLAKTPDSLDTADAVIDKRDFTVSIKENDLYVFTSVDINGFSQVKSFLNNGVNSGIVVEAAIGETAIAALAPAIKQSLLQSDGMNISEDDMRHLTACLTDDPDTEFPETFYYAEAGLLCTLNPLMVIDLGITQLYATADSMKMLGPDETADGIAGTMDLHKFEIIDEVNSDPAKPNNNIAIEMSLTKVGMGMGIWNGTKWGNLVLSSPKPGLSLPADIEYLYLEAKASVVAENGLISTTIDRDAMVLEMLGLSIDGDGQNQSFLEGIVNGLLSSDLLKGFIGNLMAGILEGIINEKLGDVGFNLYVTAENSAEFDIVLVTETISSDLDNLYLQYSGETVLWQADEAVTPALGSLYHSAALPTTVGAGGNVRLAISSNFINQALLTSYGAGLMHFTIMNDEVSFGAGDKADQGGDGDVRIRLIPTSPGEIEFSELTTSSSKVQVSFLGALLQIQGNDEGEWQTGLQIDMDFSVAMSLEVDDGSFVLKAAGSPTTDINSITNNSSFTLPEFLIQGVLDLTFGLVTPLIADKIFILQIPDVVIPDAPAISFATETVTAAGDTQRDLLFAMTLSCDQGNADCQVVPPVGLQHDSDDDGYPDVVDNCPITANPGPSGGPLNSGVEGDQLDSNADGQGDACEPDVDGDTVLDDDDNCILDVNLDQADLDNDNIGDVCDIDTAGNWFHIKLKTSGQCITADGNNISQADCLVGTGSDAVPSSDVNMRWELRYDGPNVRLYNPATDSYISQRNKSSGLERTLDTDSFDSADDRQRWQLIQDSNDGYDAAYPIRVQNVERTDMCITATVLDGSSFWHSNIDNTVGGNICNDGDENKVGFYVGGQQFNTAYDPVFDTSDFDLDGVFNPDDNCPNDANGNLLGPNNQLDSDGDGIGDVCEADTDGDGVIDDDDLCPFDVMDNCEHDKDSDGVDDYDGADPNGVDDGVLADNCKWHQNPNQENADLAEETSNSLIIRGDVCDFETSYSMIVSRAYSSSCMRWSGDQLHTQPCDASGENIEQQFLLVNAGNSQIHFKVMVDLDGDGNTGVDGREVARCIKTGTGGQGAKFVDCNSTAWDQDKGEDDWVRFKAASGINIQLRATGPDNGVLWWWLDDINSNKHYWKIYPAMDTRYPAYDFY